MSFTFGDLWDEARLSFTNPRLGARRVLALDLPMGTRWAAVVVMAAISAILFHLTLAILPPEESDPLASFAGAPIATAILQGIITVVGAFGIYLMGRLRGGRGNFPDALILFCWFQFLILGLQIVQIIAILLLPFLAEILSIVTLLAFFWLLTNFTAELHGFRSLLAVFVGVILVFFAVALVLSIVLLSLGLGPMMGAGHV